MPLSAKAWGWATRKGFEQVLATWVGNDADNLIPSWGPPDSVYNMSDGQKVLTYTINTGSGGSVVPIGTTYMYMRRQWYCKVSFMVSSSNRISSWRYEGNSCRSTAPKEVKRIENVGKNISKPDAVSPLKKFNTKLDDANL